MRACATIRLLMLADDPSVAVTAAAVSRADRVDAAFARLTERSSAMVVYHGLADLQCLLLDVNDLSAEVSTMRIAWPT
jgi:hypothetical protein